MTKEAVHLLACTHLGLAGEGEMKQQDEISTILYLHRLGRGKRAIAKELGISRGTVKKYLRNGGVQEYQQPVRTSVLDGLRDWLKERFFKHDGNADVIQQELLKKGIAVSLRTVERAVKCHRDELYRAKVATVRFETLPGQQMQVDFGEKFVWIGGERVKVHLFTAKLGYSRRMYLEAFTHENQSTWFKALEGAFRYFGGVPREVLIDNPTSLVTKNCRATKEFALNEKFKSFAQYWGFTPRACAPRRPQTKGKIESGVNYGKRNALAGREFTSWAALEEHLVSWLRDISDARALTDKEDTPLARFEEEKALLLPVEKAPYQQCRELCRKVSRDCFVDVDTNRYSVPWKYIGHEVRVLSTDTELSVQLAGEEIARHPVSASRHRRIVQAAHLDGIVYGAPVGHREEKGEPRTPATDPLARSLLEYEAVCAL